MCVLQKSLVGISRGDDSICQDDGMRGRAGHTEEHGNKKEEVWDYTVFQRGITDIMHKICDGSEIGAVQLWIIQA